MVRGKLNSCGRGSWNLPKPSEIDTTGFLVSDVT